jgi:hypothetical protein
MSIFKTKWLSNDLCREANLYVVCYPTIPHELALAEKVTEIHRSEEVLQFLIGLET